MARENVYGVELTLGNGKQISLTTYGKGQKDALMNLLVANGCGPKSQIEIYEGNSLFATRIGDATSSAKAKVILLSGIRRTTKMFYIKTRTNLIGGSNWQNLD